MMDEFSRSGLALEMSFSFPSRCVIAVLDSVAAIYGYPRYLRIDNGTELTSKLMQHWSEEHDVELLFIQPGKPTQNAYIESFNARPRSEFLNAHWFRTIAEAQTKGHAWMHAYNTTHAHSALGYRTPEEFLGTYQITPPQLSLAPDPGPTSPWQRISPRVRPTHLQHSSSGSGLVLGRAAERLEPPRHVGLCGLDKLGERAAVNECRKARRDARASS